MRYTILRQYRKEGKTPDVIKRGLTLQEAQAHCRNKDTHKAGKWFDSYTHNYISKKLGDE